MGAPTSSSLASVPGGEACGESGTAVGRETSELALIFGLDLTSAPHEAYDILDRLHGLGGEHLRARRTVGKHRVDMRRVADQPAHLGIDRREFCHRQIDQSGLEGGKLRAAE